MCIERNVKTVFGTSKLAWVFTLGSQQHGSIESTTRICRMCRVYTVSKTLD